MYLTTADMKKNVAFLPISKIVPLDQASATVTEITMKAQAEEEKKTDRKRGTSVSQAKKSSLVRMPSSADLDDDMDGTPNSFNKKDLVTHLPDLQADLIYYLVYTRPKTQHELN